jgi:hypothetical protein
MSEPHLFPQRVLSAFKRTTDIFNQRGTEYGDTWKSCTWLKFKAVAKELGCIIPDDACRALVAAGLADLKYFRFGGGYKEDNFDDGINYDGFTVEEVRHVKVERQLSYRKAESEAQMVDGLPAADDQPPLPRCLSIWHTAEGPRPPVCPWCNEELKPIQALP